MNPTDDGTGTTGFAGEATDWPNDEEEGRKHFEKWLRHKRYKARVDCDDQLNSLNTQLYKQK
jgi:hypothetical protein